MVALNSNFYYGAYFTKQSVLYFTLASSITFFFTLVLILLSSQQNVIYSLHVLYFTLAFNITFYVGAYFTEQ